MYYWIETEYKSPTQWALHQKDENGKDEVILSRSYEEFDQGDIDRNTTEYIDKMWKKIDDYIQTELGFLPAYDVN